MVLKLSEGLLAAYEVSWDQREERCGWPAATNAPRRLLLLAAGNVVSGWRLPEAEAGAQNFDLIRRATESAERGKFDFVFFADGLNTFPGMHPSMVLRFEPLTLLAALSVTTKHIGLGATASTTYTEPYNLACQPSPRSIT